MLKKNNISVFSFLISFFFSIVTLLIIFIIGENTKNFFTLFFLIFTICFISFYFSFKFFLSRTIKKLIDEFYSSEYNLSDQTNLDNLNSLSNSLSIRVLSIISLLDTLRHLKIKFFNCLILPGHKYFIIE